MSNNYVLITGASRGIGASLAKVFAKNNYNIILHGRDKNALSLVSQNITKKFNVDTKTIQADLSKIDSPEILMNSIKNLDVKILINNAGFGDHGILSEIELDKQLNMITVNISSLVKLTKLFIENSSENSSENSEIKILNISSIAAFAPGPIMSVYYATKAFVLSFSRALYVENRKKGIMVSALCPGPTISDFDINAGLSGSRLFSSGMMSSDKVAEIAYRGLIKNKPIIIPGLKNKILALVSKHISWRISSKITEYLNSKK